MQAREYSALWSSCSRSFHHPVAGTLQEAHGHCFASFVVLHGIDGGLRLITLRPRFEPYLVSELQWQRGKKDRVLRAAELDDSRLPQVRGAAPGRCDLHWDAHGAGLGVLEFDPEGKASAEIDQLWRWMTKKMEKMTYEQKETDIA